MYVIGYRPQRTLAAPTKLEGVGFVTGARVRVCLHPAAPDTGLVFARTDRPTPLAIPAQTSQVTGTQRRTTLGPAAGGVTLVEHLLATLSGLRVDNCLVELDGPEPPGLDGSAIAYAAAILQAGIVLQAARRPIWTVPTPMIVSAGGATIGLHPSAEPSLDLRISYLLNYGMAAPIVPQTFTMNVNPGEFLREVASSRTFVTAPEADLLRAQGIGRHLTPSDLLVFGNRGVIDNRLRFADEPARHKVLDLIGDLALCGFDLAGHVVAYRSGHNLNVELARRLAAMAESSSLKSVSLKFPGPREFARAA